MSRLGYAIIHAVVLAAFLNVPPVEAQDRFTFALVGDTPYFPFEVQGFATMLGTLDAEPLAFVAHVGDFKQARAPCDDAVFENRRRLFDASRHPFVFVPGDNEWTDCHASGFDPLERLAALRRVFHSGDETLGQRRFALTRQSSDARFSEYRENIRWRYGGILFVGVNVPGSNNNLGRTAEMDAEHRHRMAAVLDWLGESMTLAARDGVAGVVILLHANPGFDGKSHRPHRAPDGFVALREALRTHAAAATRPILLGHGDTHVYRNDLPLRDPASGAPLAHFTRVEVPGSPAAEPVLVDVDPSTPAVFDVRAPASAQVFPRNP